MMTYGNGSEINTQKVNSRCLNFIALIPTLLFVKCRQIFQELNSKGLFLIFAKGKRKSLSCVHVLPLRTGGVTAKKCTKKCAARAKLLFCFNKSVVFCCLSSLLKLPNIAWETVSKAFVRSKIMVEVVMPNQC